MVEFNNDSNSKQGFAIGHIITDETKTKKAIEIINDIRSEKIKLKAKSKPQFKISERFGVYLNRMEQLEKSSYPIPMYIVNAIIENYNEAFALDMIKKTDPEKETEQKFQKNRYELQKENEDLKQALENEKKKSYLLEGRLQEYRRRYEDGEPDTFTSEVTEDESG